jgi:thiamine transport system ATP-binding protein
VNGLELQNIYVSYGDQWAVEDLSLTVGEKEIVALLGPSGSGKSTLLRAVAGVEPLESGKVLWNGQNFTEMPAHKRGFVLMFQDGQLFPNMSVAKNIAYGIASWPRAEREKRVEELLEIVELPGYGTRRVNELSGGEAQRVALARSLAPRPRLLLLDEPLSALDKALRERLAAFLGETLRASGTPAIFVTHDPEEAEAIADRVETLECGKLR